MSATLSAWQPVGEATTISPLKRGREKRSTGCSAKPGGSCKTGPRRISVQASASRSASSRWPPAIWLRDGSLDDVENLPAPSVIAAEIIEDLEAALAEFAQIAESLGGTAADETEL
jgi:hypothetical protein